MPCINEGKTVYQTIESISLSNYPDDSFEVIAQDDRSVDDSYEWMLKTQSDPPEKVVREQGSGVHSMCPRPRCHLTEEERPTLF